MMHRHFYIAGFVGVATLVAGAPIASAVEFTDAPHSSPTAVGWTDAGAWNETGFPDSGDHITKSQSNSSIDAQSSNHSFGDPANASTWSAGGLRTRQDGSSNNMHSITHVADSTLNITAGVSFFGDWNRSANLGGLHNEGTINLDTTETLEFRASSGDNLQKGGPDFWNKSTGTFDFVQNGKIKFWSTSDNNKRKDFINDGTLRKSTTSGTVEINADNESGSDGVDDFFTNTGTIAVDGGDLVIRYFTGSNNSIDKDIQVEGAFSFGVNGSDNGFLDLKQNLVFTDDVELSLFDVGSGINGGEEFLVASYMGADKSGFDFLAGSGVASIREEAGGNGTNLFVTAIPEPASLALLGLGGLAMFGRRRQA